MDVRRINIGDFEKWNHASAVLIIFILGILTHLMIIWYEGVEDCKKRVPSISNVSFSESVDLGEVFWKFLVIKTYFQAWLLDALGLWIHLRFLI